MIPVHVEAAKNINNAVVKIISRRDVLKLST
jgi:hypothetical protein